MEEKFTEFLDKHITILPNGNKSLNFTSALGELYARMKTQSIQIKELSEAVGGASLMYDELLERLNKISPKIEIISELESKKILNGTLDSNPQAFK